MNKNKLEEADERINIRSIYEQSSWLARISYSYLFALNRKVRKERHSLESNDFNDYSASNCRTSPGVSSLECNWRKELDVQLVSRTRKKSKETNKNGQVESSERPTRVSLSKVVMRTYGCEFLLFSLLQVLSDCLGEPLFFYYSVQFVQTVGKFPGGTPKVDDDNHPGYDPDGHLGNLADLRVELFKNAGLFLAMLGLTSLLTQPFQWKMATLALRLRVALSQMIFKKSLVIDRQQASQVNGINHKQALSLLSRDVDLLEANLPQLCWVLSGPLECLIVTCMLTQSLGYSTALVSLVLNGAVAFQRAYMNINVRTHNQMAAKLADKRISFTNEALEGMRIIRMYSWTKSIFEKISQQRGDEIKHRSRLYFVNALDAALFFISCSGAGIFTLIFGYYFNGLQVNQGTVTQVFLVSAIYRRSLSRYVPQGILSCINLSIVFNRVGKYLLAAELAKTPTSNSDKLHGDLLLADLVTKKAQQVLVVESIRQPILRLNQLSLSWPRDQQQQHQEKSHKQANNDSSAANQQACLSRLNLEAHEGELVIVAGKVGSGKSSLLQVVLGELSPSAGTVTLNSTGTGTNQNVRPCKLAYAPQEAWIFSGTVRDNILMGEQLHLARYIEVLRVCCLLPDLYSFVSFDLTQIGERGVTLSGGQKARVNLARALYQEADLYLLDDPLSAVDAHVASQIFHKALKEFLANKTVLLVTHQLQYLQFGAKILMLNEQEGGGSFGQFGSYNELMSSGALLTLIEQNKSLAKDDHKPGELFIPGRFDSVSDELIENKMLASEKELKSHLSKLPKELEYVLVNQGQRNVYSVWRALKFYLQNVASIAQFAVFIVVNVAVRFSFIGVNIWLNYWAGFFQQQDAEGVFETTGVSAGSLTHQLKLFVAQLSFAESMAVALAIWVALILFASFRSCQFYSMVLVGARRVHEQLLRSVLWTRMRFFDTTQHGHLLNRFSADLSHMDTNHVGQLDDLSLMALSCIFIFLVIVSSELRLAVGVAGVFSVTYLIFRYCTDLTELIKHLDGFRRAAIYSHVSTSLDGLAVIRAARKQDIMLRTFNSCQDEHSSVRFIQISLRRLICNSLDYSLMLFYATLTILYVINTLNGHGMYAFVGINLVMQMSRITQYVFTRFVDFYTSVQALDRVREFSHLQDERHELDYHTDDHQDQQDHRKPAANFHSGQLEFVGVSLKYYHTNKIVLKDLRFRIEAGEKVGVVGRTGAGKSSLIAVLFHLYHFEGFVFIDDQDTKELDLDTLRKSISIIPQDPVLFSGTLRYNLDPFDEHQDSDLWRALEAVQLSRLISDHGQLGLGMEIKESGGNLSVGQRQLICLARAILRRNRLLILDEATANVDQETDGLIQQAIKREFAHCTVLTVAHRLNTIIDSDKIMVMEAGELCEFGRPRHLLELNQMFARMIDSTGAQQAHLLRAKIRQQPVERPLALTPTKKRSS